MYCTICVELIQFDGKEWYHTHTGDNYCYTGDGSTAYPHQYGLKCGCHGVQWFDSQQDRDKAAITYQCKPEWFRIGGNK